MSCNMDDEWCVYMVDAHVESSLCVIKSYNQQFPLLNQNACLTCNTSLFREHGIPAVKDDHTWRNLNSTFILHFG